MCNGDLRSEKGWVWTHATTSYGPSCGTTKVKVLVFEDKSYLLIISRGAQALFLEIQKE